MFTDAVQWGATTIPYTCEFAKTTMLKIVVRPDKSVEVVAPEGTEPEVIRYRVRRKSAWIVQSWREFDKFLPRLPPRVYVPGETHRYLGRQIRLRLVTGDRPLVRLRRGFLEVALAAEWTPALLQSAVDGWMHRRAEHYLRLRVGVCATRLAALGIVIPPVRVQSMPSRWGSCSRGGRITLNWRLIHAPSECIDYVITHELCHLVEMHHGPKFWALLDVWMPDWRERRERLNRLSLP